MSPSLQPIPNRLACNNHLIFCADKVPLAGSTIFKVCLVVFGLIFMGIGIYKLAGPTLIMSGYQNLKVGGVCFVLCGILSAISKFRRSEWAQNQKDRLEAIKGNNREVKQRVREEEANLRRTEFRELPVELQIQRTFHSSVLLELGAVCRYHEITDCDNSRRLSQENLSAIRKSICTKEETTIRGNRDTNGKFTMDPDGPKQIPAVVTKYRFVRGNYKDGMFIAIPVICTTPEGLTATDALVIQGRFDDADCSTEILYASYIQGASPQGIVGAAPNEYSIFPHEEPKFIPWLKDLLQSKECSQFVASKSGSKPDRDFRFQLATKPRYQIFA